MFKNLLMRMQFVDNATMNAFGASAALRSLGVTKLRLALKGAGVAAMGAFAGYEVFKLGQAVVDLYQVKNRQGVKLTPEAQARIDHGELGGASKPRMGALGFGSYDPQASLPPLAGAPWRALPSLREVPRPAIAIAGAIHHVGMRHSVLSGEVAYKLTRRTAMMKLQKLGAIHVRHTSRYAAEQVRRTSFSHYFGEKRTPAALHH